MKKIICLVVMGLLFSVLVACGVGEGAVTTTVEKTNAILGESDVPPVRNDAPDSTAAPRVEVLPVSPPPCAEFENYDLFARDGKAYIRIKKPLHEYGNSEWAPLLLATYEVESLGALRESLVSGGADDSPLRYLLPYDYKQSDPPHEIEIVNLNALFVPKLGIGTASERVLFGKTYYSFRLTLPFGDTSLDVMDLDRVKAAIASEREDILENESHTVLSITPIPDQNATVIRYKIGNATEEVRIETFDAPNGRYTVYEYYQLSHPSAQIPVSDTIPYMVNAFVETDTSSGFSLSCYQPTARPTPDELKAITIQPFMP
ncbi:MAG: hypothetical protein IJW46_03510 [Clostridia bacterium]|nr:hypothetical protein [Clostridia bacterium]